MVCTYFMIGKTIVENEQNRGEDFLKTLASKLTDKYGKGFSKRNLEFLGYFYFRIDFDTEKHDAGGILDSLAIDLLPRAGYSYADPNINCDYVPELEPRIISAAKAWKSAGL